MKIQEAIIGWAYSAFCMISHTEAFSHGASLVACVDMKPRHIRAQLQNPRNSYITVYTNVSFYSPGDKVPVTVRSRGDFMGFLLQARRVSDDQIAGTFVSIPSGSKLMSCFEGANTVTHLDKSPKRNLSFVWKAPQQPTGDIKFFLSVVQSYFIYWERIESTIVSQQTQNRTLSDGNVEPAASLRKPNGLEVTTTVPRARMALAQHTQPAAFAVVSPAGTSVTDSLEPALMTTETTGDEEHLLNPSPLDDMTAGAGNSDQGEQPDWDGSYLGRHQISEPSLAVPGSKNFPFQDDGSSHNPPNWPRGDSDRGPAEPCSHCAEGEQERPEAFRLSQAGPPGAPLPVHLSSSRPSMITPAEARHGGAPPSENAKASAALKRSAPRLSGLPEARSEPQDGAGEDSPGLAPPSEAGLEPGGPGSPPGPGLLSAQLGVLLCLSAALGMALAAGLRRLRAQYCRRRTRVSLREPDVPTERDGGGETGRFQKIREKSVMVVQAEYNWIAPHGGAQRPPV